MLDTICFQVPVSKLEGKYAGLYFNDSRSSEWEEFTPILTQIHENLKQNGENFEIVTILLDDEESSFNDTLAKLPFLVIPFKDKSIGKLIRYFELRSFPTFVIIGSDGKTLRNNCADIIEEHGVDAWEGFPFSQEEMGILEEKAKAKLEQQTLESHLVRGEFNYVVGKDGTKIPVSDLVGKTIILYISVVWFVSWREYLQEKELPSGKIVCEDVILLFTEYGADAYPFTKERVKELHDKIENIKGWPERIKHEVHESHELLLIKCRPFSIYDCDLCEGTGDIWSYKCRECDFYLHPECALEKVDGEDMGEEDGQNAAKEEYVCDSDVCRKVE
ncbi:Nucleoredoxin [Rhynchospora pubera]|uniref:protein-disulfide reductase n=1 Tax=Rhynchospora pubera TaxID=906938 RepID=A0AAV8CJI5_9POAL|nr:Nucleoredoxin [Rhynchospora pubera]